MVVRHEATDTAEFIPSIPKNSGGGSNDDASGANDTGGNNDAKLSGVKSSAQTDNFDSSNFPKPTNATADGEPTGSAAAAEEKSRSLPKESELQAEAEVKLDPHAIANQMARNAEAHFNLSSEEATHLRNGLTGFAMSGIELNSALVNQQVQNIAPMKFAMEEIRQQMAGIVRGGDHVTHNTGETFVATAMSVAAPARSETPQLSNR
jgi:hypothetical protein